MEDPGRVLGNARPFIVFTSNVFAILGLRSLYFVLADWVQRFHHLKPALAIVLGFVGVEMLATGFFELPVALSLAIICATLGGAVLLSWRREEQLRALAERQAAPAAVSSDKSTSTSSMAKGFSS